MKEGIYKKRGKILVKIFTQKEDTRRLYRL